MRDEIDELIEAVTVDAYGEHEQLSSFCQAFEDTARFPFPGRVVGADVEVTAVAELHRAGLDREAARLLHSLLAQDVRCVDAWVHLGLIAFETRGPGPAREFYETGVGIAEQSLPAGFGGVLPWGMIDNRPFLRCLNGLGLCAWRQRRWSEAEAIFVARVWLDPNSAGPELACLEPVRSHQRWSPD